MSIVLVFFVLCNVSVCVCILEIGNWTFSIILLFKGIFPTFFYKFDFIHVARNAVDVFTFDFQILNSFFAFFFNQSKNHMVDWIEHTHSNPMYPMSQTNFMWVQLNFIDEPKIKREKERESEKERKNNKIVSNDSRF